ncbi:HTH domain-containing protein [Enterococcus pseudoavium]|uniref:HTH domain-containing protein n=1 Tax=Enterococcus pseudoavium TaxID=44007 RepID=A0ABU3FGU6_9ENTE|nr:PRD domain-containing protein [Enterococcus pseudoavium]MDT2754273.1 HTH domain-containing protein [Enterococcus pseudoavium]MDT2769945.1 HTH domain-containing protein [Enterococcus pseudoavium]
MQPLTKRESHILIYLLETSEPVTIKKLAEKENVSIRTIKYDLDDIREWLIERKQELQSKRSQGIWLKINDSDRIKLKSELMDVNRLEVFADQNLRIDRLLIMLLLTNESVTSMKLANMLEVSKDTIMNDLDVLEKDYLKEGLRLNRQARKGFVITGEERLIRLTIEEILQKDFTDYDIYKLMALLLNGEENEHFEMYSAIATPIQEVFNQVIIRLRKLLEFENLEELNYAELLNILIRVTISTVRLRNESTIGGYQLIAEQELDKNDLSYRVMQQVFAYYQLPLFEAEYHYIYSDTFDTLHQQDVMKLVENVIDKVSKKIDYPFYQDPQLLTNLYAHLSMRLSRKKKFVNEYNPFKDDIKQKYPKLFEAINEAVTQELSGQISLINDSFVAYIALHFLVSYEREEDLRSVRAVYICSTGLGVTSLIKQKINEELNNITIVAFASVLNAQEMIAKKDPDLVISIFPIKGVDRPFIKVHPLPTEQDLQTIQQTVKKILASTNQQEKHKLKFNETPINKDTLEDFSKELILKAYTTYERLLVVLANDLIQEYREAFLLHVFLMVHRITFDQQYIAEGSQIDQIILAREDLVEKIEAVFAENNLSINKSEISALFSYIKGGASN